MRLAEVCLWDTLYVSLYTPLAIVATVIAGAELNPIALLIAGTMCCSILTVYLCFQGDLLFRRIPRMMDAPTETKQEQPGRLVDMAATTNPMPCPEQVKPKKRRRRRKAEIVAAELEQQLEVQANVKEKPQKTKPAKTFDILAGVEPEPKMRTDVDLDELDADDDDPFSKCD